MGTTKAIIESWISTGLEKDATHMIVMCDSFSYDDYPVYVFEGQDPKKVMPKGDMQRPMECYDLRMDIQSQMDEHRANHWKK